jgi:hypothetical protein
MASIWPQFVRQLAREVAQGNAKQRLAVSEPVAP